MSSLACRPRRLLRFTICCPPIGNPRRRTPVEVPNYHRKQYAKPSRRHEPPPSGLTDSGRVTAARFTATTATLDGASPPLCPSPYTTPVRAARPCASPPAYAPPRPTCNHHHRGTVPTS